jgi:hypothetical protein
LGGDSILGKSAKAIGVAIDKAAPVVIPLASAAVLAASGAAVAAGAAGGGAAGGGAAGGGAVGGGAASGGTLLTSKNLLLASSLGSLAYGALGSTPSIASSGVDTSAAQKAVADAQAMMETEAKTNADKAAALQAESDKAAAVLAARRRGSSPYVTGAKGIL